MDGWEIGANGCKWMGGFCGVAVCITGIAGVCGWCSRCVLLASLACVAGMASVHGLWPVSSLLASLLHWLVSQKKISIQKIQIFKFLKKTKKNASHFIGKAVVIVGVADVATIVVVCIIVAHIVSGGEVVGKWEKVGESGRRGAKTMHMCSHMTHPVN